MTDKQLAIKARRRLSILEANDIQNDTIDYYKQMVENFYKQNHIKKTSKSGFSITKQMNVKQRKEMRQLLRGFMKEEETSPAGIKAEYERKFKYYSETTQKMEVMPASSLKEMNESIQKLDRTLSDRAISRYLDSEQINAIANHSKALGISFDKYRTAVLDMIKESNNDNLMSRGMEREVTTDDIIMDESQESLLYEQYSDDELVDEVIARVMGDVK